MSSIATLAVSTMEPQAQAVLFPYLTSRAGYVQELASHAKADVHDRLSMQEHWLRKTGRAIGGLLVPAAFGLELTIANETVAGGTAIAAAKLSNELLHSADNIYERVAFGIGSVIGTGILTGAVSYIQQRAYGRIMRMGLNRMPSTVDYLASTLSGSRGIKSSEKEHDESIQYQNLGSRSDQPDARLAQNKLSGSKLLKWLRYPVDWTAIDTLTARTGGTSLNLLRANVVAGRRLSDEESARTEHGSALAISRFWTAAASGVVTIPVITGTAKPELMEEVVDFITAPQVLTTIGVMTCGLICYAMDIKSIYKKITNRGDKSRSTAVSSSSV